MKKQMIRLIALALIFASCKSRYRVSDQDEGKKLQEQAAQYIDKTFDEVLSSCTDTAIGVVIENEKKLMFRITDVLSGGSLSPGKELEVATSEETKSYHLGEEYLLLLGRHISVFFDQDRYVMQGSARIPLKHLEEAKILEQPMQNKADPRLLVSSDALIGYVQSYSLTTDHYGIDYLQSASMEETLAFADAVVKIRLGEQVPVETVGDRKVYEAVVLALYKGECEAENVLAVLPAGDEQWTSGEDLIIAAASAEEGSPFLLVPVSRGSIYSEKDEERIAALTRG